MALAASMPVIGDLTMKFSRHSLHDSFQLPATFYQCFGQAKDIALYFQPNGLFASPKLGKGTLFEFKGSSVNASKRHYQPEVAEHLEKDAFTSHFSERRTSTAKETTDNTKQTTYANPANTSSDKEATGFTASREETDEELSSDEEELTSYFSQQSEQFSERLTSNDSRNTEPSSTRTHNRKRSMEQEEYSTIKRCCRPRLNFEKMQLNREMRRDCTESRNLNYFRPISPQDVLS